MEARGNAALGHSDLPRRDGPGYLAGAQSWTLCLLISLWQGPWRAHLIRHLGASLPGEVEAPDLPCWCVAPAAPGRLRGTMY